LQVVALLVSVAPGRRLHAFNKKIKSIPVTDAASQRLAAYRAAAITRWATIEGPALFSLISFLITGNMLSCIGHCRSCWYFWYAPCKAGYYLPAAAQ